MKKYFVYMPLNRTYTGIVQFDTKEEMDAWMAENAPDGQLANGDPAIPSRARTYDEWRKWFDEKYGNKAI